MAEELAQLCQSDQRTDPVETIASELIPLCDALRWIGRRGPAILADRKLNWRDRPFWMWGVRSRVRHDPLGRVLILAAWNYPLLLAGVQVAQALAAGNTVLLKPAPGCEPANECLVNCFYQAGVPREALTLLSSDVAAATSAMDAGIDLVVLTGSAATGRKVLARAAQTLTPCILELGGCDAVMVLDGADLVRVGQAIRFGLTFNASATCIGPRRLIVPHQLASDTVDALVAPWLNGLPPVLTVHPSARSVAADIIERAISAGAIDVLGRFCAERLRGEGRMFPTILNNVSATDEIASADLFAPVISVLKAETIDQAVHIVNRSPYRLAASVFGPLHQAQQIASRLQVGSVVVNDLIAPTADPRLPFGGRGQSGFGVTRGEEGLLAMTAAVSVSIRTGPPALHLAPRRVSDAQTLLGLLQWKHSRGFSNRFIGLRKIIAAFTTKQ